MTKQLHPTLKACKCGKVFTRKELYKHFDVVLAYFKEHGHEKDFCIMHGEVPLNIDDPRTKCAGISHEPRSGSSQIE